MKNRFAIIEDEFIDSTSATAVNLKLRKISTFDDIPELKEYYKMRNHNVGSFFKNIFLPFKYIKMHFNWLQERSQKPYTKKGQLIKDILSPLFGTSKLITRAITIVFLPLIAMSILLLASIKLFRQGNKKGGALALLSSIIAPVLFAILTPFLLTSALIINVAKLASTPLRIFNIFKRLSRKKDKSNEYVEDMPTMKKNIAEIQRILTPLNSISPGNISIKRGEFAKLIALVKLVQKQYSYYLKSETKPRRSIFSIDYNDKLYNEVIEQYNKDGAFNKICYQNAQNPNSYYSPDEKINISKELIEKIKKYIKNDFRCTKEELQEVQTRRTMLNSSALITKMFEKNTSTGLPVDPCETIAKHYFNVGSPLAARQELVRQQFIQTIETKDFAASKYNDKMVSISIVGGERKVPLDVAAIYKELVTTEDASTALENARAHKDYSRFFAFFDSNTENSQAGNIAGPSSSQ